MRRTGRAGKIAGWILGVWFCFVVFGLGLIGNAYMAVSLWFRGEWRGALMFCVFFGGACTFCYRARDDIGYALRALVKRATGYEMRDPILKKMEEQNELQHRIAVDNATRARQARCVETCVAWNGSLERTGEPFPTPSLGTALIAGHRWLQIKCPVCQNTGEVDLATIDRHPEAPLFSLVASLKCRFGCSNSGPPQLVALSVTPTRRGPT